MSGLSRSTSCRMLLLAMAVVPAACGGTGTMAEPKTAFETVDRLPQRDLSEADWQDAKRALAIEALDGLSEPWPGEDVFYVAMLESVAGRWEPAADHFQEYLAQPESDDHETVTNRRTAGMRLRDVFVQGHLVEEAERYYADDPIGLAIFVSQLGDHERTLQIYEDYLASGPAPDRARTTKSLIVITLGTMNRPDEMAHRMDEFMADLTPNNIVNGYATLTRLYLEAGDQARADEYRRRLFEYALDAGDAKAVDGPVNAHINWMIKRFETAGDASALNDFIHLVRTELASKPAIMANLDSREVFREAIGKPAAELAIDWVVGGEPVTLADLRGRVVMLDFLAHWCGPCIADFPMVRDLQQRLEPEGLTVLGLTRVYGYYRGERPLTPDEEVARMRDHFVGEYDVTWPLVFASTEANEEAYGVSYIPHVVLIDREGIVRYAKVGRGDPAELEREIRALLNFAHSVSPLYTSMVAMPTMETSTGARSGVSR